MVDSTTQHYGWTKPELQKAPTTWGKSINDNLDSLDSLVFANQQGIAPVGAIIMFAGATAPPNWLLCNGASIDTTVYAKLFAVIGNTFGGVGSAGNFQLPNLTQRFPLGTGNNPLGQTGGTFSYTISTANLPAHAHPITDKTHAHTINQSVHGHADPGHTHGVSDPTHTHGGIIRSGGPTQFATGPGYAAASGTTTDAAATGISIQAAGTGIQPALANISLNASGTGLSTTQNAGGGAAISIVPQYVALNFIIRFQ